MGVTASVDDESSLSLIAISGLWRRKYNIVWLPGSNEKKFGALEKCLGLWGSCERRFQISTEENVHSKTMFWVACFLNFQQSIRGFHSFTKCYLLFYSLVLKLIEDYFQAMKDKSKRKMRRKEKKKKKKKVQKTKKKG